MKLLDLASDNYGTYKSSYNDTAERHVGRLLSYVFLSITVALFSSDTASIYPIMVTGITILTGFAFTALFSDHVLADVGLPKANNESDRADIVRLASLSVNFKARSKYFISLSILEATFLIVASLKFSIPKLISEYVSNVTSSVDPNTMRTISIGSEMFGTVVCEIISVAIIFLFLECLYTFYRLTETIIVIVETRRDYLRASENHEGQKAKS